MSVNGQILKKASAISNNILKNCTHCDGSIEDREGCLCLRKSNLIIELAFANIPFELWLLPLRTLQCNKIAKNQVKKYCSKIKRAYKSELGLCFYGGFGRGKTSLSVHVLKKAHLAGFSIYFSTLSEFLIRIKDGFDLSNEDKVLHRTELEKNFIQSQFLVLDNVGQEYRRDGSTFVSIQFDEIIRKRKAEGNVTILSTNKDYKKLKDVYGSAVFSILQGSMKLIQIRGKDHREGKADKLWINL